jgi:hypothetical protein
MADIAERQHAARARTLGLTPALKKVVDDYVSNLEIATGMDIDGDGDQGNIGHGVVEDRGTKVDLTQDEAVQVELWATRIKAVEEDIKATREAEKQVRRSVFAVPSRCPALARFAAFARLTARVMPWTGQNPYCNRREEGPGTPQCRGGARPERKRL